MDLVPDEQQRQIRDSVRSVLDARAPVARLHGTPHDLELWPQFGALGWFGLGLDGLLGGLGLGVAEEMIVAVECGRALLSPALVGTLIGVRLAAEAGEAALAAAILAGEQPVGVALARDRPSRAGQAAVLLVDTAQGHPFCLWRPGAIALYPWAALSGVRAMPSLDEAISLAEADLSLHAAISATHDPALPARADVLVAAMLAGLAERATAAAVDYALIREQFGRPIGSFQAIKHRCADMAVRATAAAAQCLFAALTLDGQLPGAGLEASAARIVAAEAAVANAAAMVQIHGGIGYTQECDAQLFVKRAQLLSRIGGDVGLHERRLLDEATH